MNVFSVIRARCKNYTALTLNRRINMRGDYAIMCDPSSPPKAPKDHWHRNGLYSYTHWPLFQIQ